MKTLKKTLATILAGALAVSSINPTPINKNIKYEDKVKITKGIGMMMQTAGLIYIDEYKQTKYALDNYPTHLGEYNKYAKLFFDKGLWDLKYLTDLILVGTADYFFNKIDDKRVLSTIFETGLSLLEMGVIYFNYNVIKEMLLEIPQEMRTKPTFNLVINLK